MHRRRRGAVILCLPLALSACSNPAERGLENRQLGLSFVALPQGFEVSSNQGASFELVRSDDPTGSRMWIEVGPLVAGGINLVEVIRRQKAAFEALPGGEFAGNRELVTPQGPAYYSRGRFEDGEAQVEETRIFSLHPTENRLLTLHYRYPAGDDSVERINELLTLVGELEGISQEVGEGEDDTPEGEPTL